MFDASFVKSVRLGAANKARGYAKMIEPSVASVPVSVLVRGALPSLPPDAQLAPGDDLYAAGLTSIGLVNLMLAVEAAYGVAIPDKELTPANFRSIDAIEGLVRRLATA
jgi:acyl carrier protein